MDSFKKALFFKNDEYVFLFPKFLMELNELKINFQKMNSGFDVINLTNRRRLKKNLSYTISLTSWSKIISPNTPHFGRTIFQRFSQRIWSMLWARSSLRPAKSSWLCIWPGKVSFRRHFWSTYSRDFMRNVRLTRQFWISHEQKEIQQRQSQDSNIFMFWSLQFSWFGLSVDLRFWGLGEWLLLNVIECLTNNDNDGDLSKWKINERICCLFWLRKTCKESKNFTVTRTKIRTHWMSWNIFLRISKISTNRSNTRVSFHFRRKTINKWEEILKILDRWTGKMISRIRIRMLPTVRYKGIITCVDVY